METNDTKEQKKLERKASALLSRSRTTSINKSNRRTRKRNKKYDDTVLGYLDAEKKEPIQLPVTDKKTRTKPNNVSIKDSRLPNTKIALSDLQKVCNKQSKKIKALQKQVKHLESLIKQKHI